MFRYVSSPNYSVSPIDSILNCFCVASTVITLYPGTKNTGKLLTVRKTDSTSNTITINPVSGETIDGASSVTMYSQNEYITLYSDENGWAVIDSNTGLSTVKSRLTPEGGVAVKMTNKTGGASVKGEVVTVYSSTSIDKAVSKIVVDIPAPIGAFYESGVADGSEVWVVISGIADVYFVGNTTRGHLARGFLTADGGSYVLGQALSEAVPSSPFASDKHFYEIGHVLESRTGAGLSKCVLHFN